jgi:N-acetylmuramoyl-L-alanine amidase
MAVKVWLDPGHGGSDPGACANGLVESQMTLTTALKTKEVLEAHGVVVGMSRTSDVYVDLNKRCRMANNWGADFFVSVHYNAGGGDGAETIHSIYHGQGEQLAQVVLSTIGEMLGQNLRKCYAKKGSNGDYFYVIRETTMPAIIVEGAFIDSNDMEIVNTIAKQQAMGTAIAAGILKFLGIPYVPGAPVPAQSTTTGTSGDYGMGVVTADVLNVRAGAGTNYAKLGQLTEGTEVKICSISGNWANIYFGNHGGWVCMDYIKVTQVFKKPKTAHSSSTQGNTIYRVVVGSYKDRKNAEKVRAQLKDKGFDSFLLPFNKNGVDYLRVISGSYKDKVNAETQQNKLKAAGFNTFLAAY